MRDVSVIAFDVLVATAQLVLAVTLLARRRRPGWAWPLAGIFAANAGQAALDAVTLPYATTWSTWIYQGLDLAIFLCFVHLALSFPERPRMLRRPWALPGVLVLTAAVLVGVHAWFGADILRPRYYLANPPQLLVGYAFPAAAWTLLLGRWAWRWRGMRAASRETFQWLFAAFAMRAANILTVTFPVQAVDASAGLFLVARILNLIPLLAVMAVGSALIASFVQETGAARKQTLFVMGFLMAGFLEAFVASAAVGDEFYTDFAIHLDILLVRPVLVWCAMALHDGGEPSWSTRWPGLAAVGGLVLAVFAAQAGPSIHYGLPGWQGAVVSVALGVVVAAGAMIAARAWLASRDSGRGDAAASPPWTPGQKVLGRYRIDRLLGEGSTGAAYLAHDLRGDGAIVLKRTRNLSPDLRQALMTEASTAAELRHPNIVRLLRVEQEAEDPILVLEHVAGGSLRTRMAEGPIGVPEAVRIASDILAALEAAHAEGIVHRDVKPENVMLDRAGNAKLADFGSAEVVHPASALGNPTHAGHQSPGSLRYMSPEQVRGRSLDARTDLYSLAVVLYEMVAARHPVPEGLSDYQVRQHIAERPPPRLGAAVPRKLQAAISRGLQKAPSRRFQSATEFRRALGRATGS